jgi:ribose/xylose/arabinose/galactoside ABC-type transport system permease subunit
MTVGEVHKKARKQSLFKRFENATVLTILVVFVVVIVVLQLIITGGKEVPTFVRLGNIFNVIQQVAVPGIAAVGMTMVMISGGIDLSVGMLASLVSIVTAKGIADWHLGTAPAIIIAIAVAVLLETILGYIISRTNVEPFIVTLGGMITFKGIALLVCNSREVTVGGQINFIKVNLLEGVKDPVSGLSIMLPPFVLVFFAIVVIAWALLKFTKYGRRLYAVGSNPNAAYLAGINVKNIKLSVYMINGLLVGIGAVMLLARVNTGIISLGEGMEIDAIAMAVIGGTAMSGGKGNIWGTFFGVILLGSIGNAMNMLKLQSEWQFVAKGVIIIIAVAAGAMSANVMALVNRIKNKSEANKASN